MPDAEGSVPDAEGSVPDTSTPEVAAPAPDPTVARLLAELRAGLGDDLVGHAEAFGHLVVRVRRDAWRQAAEIAKHRLECDFLSFVSGIDWHPAPRVETEAGGDTSSPVQPTEMTFGLAGSEGRFQVLAHVQSTSRHHGLTLKTDVVDDAAVPSWVPVYAGADWHERECWEMFGFPFEGHPAMRHLYLPHEFEGHPLRKDFPLLAREVKPWPGIVDVEGMPGEDTEGGGSEAPDAGAGGGG